MTRVRDIELAAAKNAAWITAHDKVCAERYLSIQKTLDRILYGTFGVLVATLGYIGALLVKSVHIQL